MSAFYQTIHHKSFYGALFLCALVPILAVEVPRVLAFIPLLSILFLWPNLTRENFKPLKSEKITVGFLCALFIFMVGHSLFLSISPDATERTLKLIPLIFGGGLFLYLIRRTPEFNHEKFNKILMGLCAFAALIIIVEITQGSILYRLMRGIGEGEVVRASVFNRGAVSIIVIFLTAFMLLKHKKSYVVLASFIPIFALFFTIESQSAQLGFFFALAFYFLFPFKFKFIWLALYAAICIYILSFPFVMPALYEAIPADIFKNGFLKSAYASIRIEIWDFVSRKILENPWQGFGLEFTRSFENFDARQIYTKRTTILHPHNMVLQIWIELGLVGILFLKAAIASMLITLYHQKSDLIKKTGLTMLITFLLLNSFSYGLWQGWWIGLMFIVSGLILLVSNQRDVIKKLP